MHFVKLKDKSIINLEEIVTVLMQIDYGDDEECEEYGTSVTYEILFKNNTTVTLSKESEYETIVKALRELNVLTEES